jgi:hypothetical protein
VCTHAGDAHTSAPPSRSERIVVLSSCSSTERGIPSAAEVDASTHTPSIKARDFSVHIDVALRPAYGGRTRPRSEIRTGTTVGRAIRSRWRARRPGHLAVLGVLSWRDSVPLP